MPTDDLDTRFMSQKRFLITILSHTTILDLEPREDLSHDRDPKIDDHVTSFIFANTGSPTTVSLDASQLNTITTIYSGINGKGIGSESPFGQLWPASVVQIGPNWYRGYQIRLFQLVMAH